MCLMCLEIAKDRMTVQEARKALPELVDTSKTAEDIEHYKELQQADDETLKKLAKEAAEKITSK